MTDVFVSYKREDRARAKALAEVLAQRGLDVWWDIELLPGSRFADEIRSVIERARAVVVLWSDRSVASDYVRAEADLARRRDTLIPVRLDACDPPIPFNGLHTLDLTNWDGQPGDPRLAALMEAVVRRVGHVPTAPRNAPEVESRLHGADAEAALWRAITEQAAQSAEEYRHYLSKYGDTALFAELAKIRIARLERPSLGRIVARLTGVVLLVSAVLALVPQARQALQEFGELLNFFGGSGPNEDADCRSPQDFAVCRDDLADGTPCPFCPEMVALPGGTFMMGSPEDEAGRRDAEETQHEVTVGAFAIGMYEVTFDQWDACVDDGGCGHRPGDEDWGREDRPVIDVDWQDTQEFVRWLSEETGEAYRLPTEAEWEYAARAGTTTAYPWGDTWSDDQANGHTSVGRTMKVGVYPANAWGLHDMIGNVWEWVEDCWNAGYEGAPPDGTAWVEPNCSERVVRGGAWDHLPKNLRSAYRGGAEPGHRGPDGGFRVARTLTPSVFRSPQDAAHGADPSPNPPAFSAVMPGLDPGIHGSSGQARR